MVGYTVRTVSHERLHAGYTVAQLPPASMEPLPVQHIPTHVPSDCFRSIESSVRLEVFMPG